jgi:hypothetical protein
MFDLGVPAPSSVNTNAAAIGFQPDEIVPQIEGDDLAMKDALKIVGSEKPNSTLKQTVLASGPQIAANPLLRTKPTASFGLSSFLVD